LKEEFEMKMMDSTSMKQELRTDRGEAEVEIDAITGKALEVEWDD
jgi:uncharacterized membrane protein YkoI